MAGLAGAVLPLKPMGLPRPSPPPTERGPPRPSPHPQKEEGRPVPSPGQSRCSLEAGGGQQRRPWKVKPPQGEARRSKEDRGWEEGVLPGCGAGVPALLTSELGPGWREGREQRTEGQLVQGPKGGGASHGSLAGSGGCSVAGVPRPSARRGGRSELGPPPTYCSRAGSSRGHSPLVGFTVQPQCCPDRRADPQRATRLKVPSERTVCLEVKVAPQTSPGNTPARPGCSGVRARRSKALASWRRLRAGCRRADRVHGPRAAEPGLERRPVGLRDPRPRFTRAWLLCSE